jgi:non-specific serine/threonine protein kinase
MVRRMPLDKPVRTPDTDTDFLRVAASAANEAVDAMTQLPAPRIAAALVQVAQRYARVLGVGVKEVQEALEAGRAALKSGGIAETGAGGADEDELPADTEPVPAGASGPIGLQRG